MKISEKIVDKKLSMKELERIVGGVVQTPTIPAIPAGPFEGSTTPPQPVRTVPR